VPDGYSRLGELKFLRGIAFLRLDMRKWICIRTSKGGTCHDEVCFLGVRCADVSQCSGRLHTIVLGTKEEYNSLCNS